jgi:hypothetical protein
MRTYRQSRSKVNKQVTKPSTHIMQASSTDWQLQDTARMPCRPSLCCTTHDWDCTDLCSKVDSKVYSLLTQHSLEQALPVLAQLIKQVRRAVNMLPLFGQTDRQVRAPWILPTYLDTASLKATACGVTLCSRCPGSAPSAASVSARHPGALDVRHADTAMQMYVTGWPCCCCCCCCCCW